MKYIIYISDLLSAVNGSEGTARDLGIEVDDALEMAEQTESLNEVARRAGACRPHSAVRRGRLNRRQCRQG